MGNFILVKNLKPVLSISSKNLILLDMILLHDTNMQAKQFRNKDKK